MEKLDFLEGVKFVDLHSHLGSSISPTALWELAHEQGLKLDNREYFKFVESLFVEKEIDHDEYLKKFHIVQKIQSSPLSIEKSVFNAISTAYRKYNISTLELRFNPFKRNRGNYEYDADKIIVHALMGLKKALLVYPMRAGIILETDRTYSYDASVAIAHKAVKYKDQGIIGFDMSGPIPENFSINNHIAAFEIAAAGELNITVHTGETSGPEEIEEFIRVLKPDRIGHGVMAYKSAQTMKMLADNEITLEICPTSNLKTGVVKSNDEFKEIFERFHHYGVRYTINTDGPTFLKTTLKNEYEYLYWMGILTKEQILQAIKNGHDYSFIR